METEERPWLYKNFQSRIRRNFKQYWGVEGDRVWKTFLIQDFSLGTDNPEEMWLFSVHSSDSKYSNVMRGKSTSSPAGGLWFGASLSPLT